MSDAQDRKLAVRSLFDELSATYDSFGVDFFGRIARGLVGRAGLRPGSSVLDVGCGAGAALIPAAGAVGPAGRVLGIDLASGMVERARRAVRELGLENVHVQVGDAEAPPGDASSVDAIVSSLVLFFLPDIDRALDAFADRLVAGGTLAFSTFVGEDDWAHIDAILETFDPAPRRGHEEAWYERPSGIRGILDRHGYRTVSIEDVTHEVEFPDVATFHEWMWSTGCRADWQAIPLEQRTAARAAVDDHLRSIRERHGCLRLATAVRYTRAESARVGTPLG